MNITRDYIWTKNGARLYRYSQSNSSSLNWLFVPPPGLGSESLLELAALLKDQIKGSLWMLDHPNDGNNLGLNMSFANWQDALIEAVTMLKQPIIIGHSTGAKFIQATPQLEGLISAVILISSAPDMEWKDKFNQYMLNHLSPEINQAIDNYTNSPSDDNLNGLLIATLKFCFLPSSLNAGIEMVKGLSVNHKAADWSDNNFDTEYKAKFIPKTLPTLIMTGEQDQIIPLSVYTSKPEYQQDNIIIKPISNASHYPWFDNPQQMRQIIHKFINKFKIE